MTRVAILDDDAVMLEVLSELLERSGFTCSCFTSGRQLIRKLHEKSFDLFLLDWNLPDMSGINVMGWISTQIGHMPPVLLVTSRSTEEDIVTGLQAGADDFISKPIQPSALLARIEALLRRASPDLNQTQEVFGIYLFDLVSKTVSLSGRSVQMKPKEFSLAVLLFRNRNRAITRAQLSETIWGFNASDSSRTLDVHISRIKNKLELVPANGFCLKTVYGYGYRLEAVL